MLQLLDLQRTIPGMDSGYIAAGLHIN